MFEYMFNADHERSNGEERSLASLCQRGHISLYVPAPVSIGSECTVEGVSRALLGALACVALSAPLGGAEPVNDNGTLYGIN